MGQAGGDLSNDLDFDMEWAYYSLMDEEDVVNHDTEPSKRASLPAAPVYPFCLSAHAPDLDGSRGRK